MYLLEPLVPLYNRQRAVLLLANGKTDAGVRELVRLNGSAAASVFLAGAYAQQQRFAEAADLLVQPQRRQPFDYTTRLFEDAA